MGACLADSRPRTDDQTFYVNKQVHLESERLGD